MDDSDDIERLNFIPCLTWVKRGVAKAEPEKVKLSEDELKALLHNKSSESTAEQENNSPCSETEEIEREQSKVLSKAVTENSTGDDNDNDVVSKYGFDKYDSEDGAAVIGGFSGLAVYSSNKEDPYVTVPDDSDNDSEKEDEIIRPSDNLILVGRVLGDQASLEVYVHNEEEESLYVHHEIYLPDLPFCLEWLSYDPSSPSDGNLCAIGGMSPVIHVMDLDVIDCLEPAYSLGNGESNNEDPFAAHFGKKGKKSKKKHNYVGHKEAVLDLSWNTNFIHVLASGSVDQTVILWDLESGAVNTTLDSFREKVQSVKWHPFEGQTLLTGSCDTVVRVFDCRSKDSYKAWQMSGEVERVLWDHYKPFCFLASTDTGNIHYVDCRNDKPVWELSAHSKEVTGLALSASCPGLLCTASSDGFVKVWDIQDNIKPVHVWETNPKLGNIHCLGVNPDLPFTLAAGGDRRSPNLGVWDLIDNSAVGARFSNRPLLIPKKEDVTSASGNTVMDTVTSAMDDLCLALSNDPDDKLKKLPKSSIRIKKKKPKTVRRKASDGV